MYGKDLQTLVQYLAKLPGLGPRSGRRAALHLLKHREDLMHPLIEALTLVRERIRSCGLCGNYDTTDPCQLCKDPGRDDHLVCVVESVADLWALERAACFRGRYHVLGGTLSVLEGVQPEDLKIPQLLRRLQQTGIQEVILALNATVDGQTTAHYLADRLEEAGVQVTALAHGVPIGGELDYLDDGTLSAAIRARRNLVA
ncbi:MAG: recombination protein RecR [Caedimonas sp.]|nr:recombination protein RecR [Caedimonas sp.]